MEHLHRHQEPTIDLAERYAAVLAEVQQKERGGAIMSGRQEYREFRPVELYDVAAVESWLEEGTGRAITCCGSGGFTESFIRIAPSLSAATGSSPCCAKRSLRRRR